MDINLEAYQRAGIFPEAVVNYAALLGWSHNLGSDFLPLPRLIQNFTLKFTKGNTVVDTGKLTYLQKLHAESLMQAGGPKLDSIVAEIESLARGQYEDTVKLVCPQFFGGESLSIGSLDIDYSNLYAYIVKLLQATARQYTTPQDFFRRHLYFFRTPPQPAWVKSPRLPIHAKDECIVSAVQKMDEIPQEEWVEAVLTVKLQSIAQTASEENDCFMDLAETRRRVSENLRTILLAGNSGPGMVETMILLGREVTLRRIASAMVEI